LIDEKLMVSLGGIDQKIHIRTDDGTKPVLLFLHGGPGVCNRNTIMTHHADLADTFTMVTWDQRGSGGSWKGVEYEKLTIDMMVEDANDLVGYLCRRFDKDRIFIIGGSWGSLLGARLANKHPEHIAAFVGFGQFVNGALNEKISYEYTLAEAEKAGDAKGVEALKKLGAPVLGVYKGGYDGMMIQRNLMMKYGGYSKNEKKRSYLQAFIVPMVTDGEFSLYDIFGLVVGHKKVLKAMWPEVGATDLESDCVDFDVPVFIFDGRLDKNTPADLVEHWYDMINAPEKCLVWFDNSGHNPMGDEGERFKRLLREKLIAVKEREACRI